MRLSLCKLVSVAGTAHACVSRLDTNAVERRAISFGRAALQHPLPAAPGRRLVEVTVVWCQACHRSNEPARWPRRSGTVPALLLSKEKAPRGRGAEMLQLAPTADSYHGGE